MDIYNFKSPNWKKRKLERFLFTTLKNEPAKVDDEEIQDAIIMIAMIENKLQDLFLNDKESFDKIFDLSASRKEKFQILKLGLDQFLIKEYSKNKPFKWYNKIISPMIQAYAELYGKCPDHWENYIEAAKSLADKLFDPHTDFACLLPYFHDKNSQLHIIKTTPFTRITVDDMCFAEAPYNWVSKTYASNQTWSIYPLNTNQFHNVDFLKANRNAPVFVINSIELAQKLQNKYVQYNSKKEQIFVEKYLRRYSVDLNKVLHWKSKSAFSSEYVPIKISKLIWLSWFGGASALNNIDLNCLKRRAVYWVYYQDGSKNEFIAKFLEIYSILPKESFGDLQFIHVPEVKDRLNRKNTKISIWSPKELLLEAFRQDIEVPESIKKEQAAIVAKEVKTPSREEYILYPLLRKKSLILLTAEAKHGKSYFAMALSHAVATHGKLFQNFKVKTTTKVLYVLDDEIDYTERKKREGIFHKIFKQKEKSKDVVYEHVSGFNLYEDHFRKRVECMLINAQMNTNPQGEPVQLLVLDHLTKMINNNLTGSTWRLLRPWLHQLREKYSLAVLILHHTNKSGKTYGTSFIENDANAHIHIHKKPIDDTLTMEITVPQNRNGQTITEPITVELNLGKNPSLRPGDGCDSYKIEWKGTIEDRCILFAKMKQEGCTMKEIANSFNVSKPTIEKFAQENGLTNEGWKRWLESSSQ